MRTELIYLWIEKDENECFEKQGFNFSPNFCVKYDAVEKKLQIKEIENINVFRDANVSNATAVVGKNGTGKTTLMQYITALNDIQPSRKMEIKYPEKRYSDRKNRFLAVYLKDGESTFDIVNLTGNTIEYSGRKYENFEFERSVNESYTKNMSHIYFSNSAYINHENLNLRQNEINYITLTDAALDVLQREFYKRIYGVDDNIKKNADETPFNILENYYVSQENNQAFQSLLDVFYYLNQYKNGGEFCGKRIKEVDVSIEFSDMREDGDDEENRDKQEKMPFRDPFEDGKRMAWKIRDKMIISDFWDVLICNLVYELGASFAEFTVCPYCNRNFIFTVPRHTGNGGVRPEYDHFFPKSKYPYLAASMYNLIPSCSVCNKAKSNRNSYKNHEVQYLYPYEEGYGEQIVLKIEDKNKPTDKVTAWLGSAEEYTVYPECSKEVDSEKKKRVENSWEMFKLGPLYEKHSDYIRNILQAKQIYTEEYLEQLVKNFPSAFDSMDDLKNMVYFNYLDEKDWGKRILAKLTHDLEADNP